MGLLVPTTSPFPFLFASRLRWNERDLLIDHGRKTKTKKQQRNPTKDEEEDSVADHSSQLTTPQPLLKCEEWFAFPGSLESRFDIMQCSVG